MPADWTEVVVKPATSAGSRDTARYTRDDERVWPHVERLLDGGRVAMLQPYHHGVDVRGETGLVYAERRRSRTRSARACCSSRVASMTDQLFAPEDISPRVADAEERRSGRRSHALCHRRRFGTPAYARVDLLPGPQVIEVELSEPSLYLVIRGGRRRSIRGRFAAQSGAR